MKTINLKTMIKEEIQNVLKEDADFETTADLLGKLHSNFLKHMKILKKSQKDLVGKELAKIKNRQDRNDTLSDVTENFYSNMWDDEWSEDARDAAIGGYS